MGIRVTDLDRSLAFYSGALGLEEERRGDNLAYGGGNWVLLRDPRSGMRLELNWYPPESRWAIPYEPGEGLDHIGFVVKDVRATYQELLDHGAESRIDPDVTEGWTAYVADPDRNWIEIYRLPEAE